jgi:hypothetical protein
VATKYEVLQYLAWVKSEVDNLSRSLTATDNIEWDDLLVAIKTTMMNEESIALVRDNLEDYKRP